MTALSLAVATQAQAAIDHIDLLPHTFERVVVPSAVQTELSNSLAPLAVQRSIADSPGLDARDFEVNSISIN